VAHADAAGGGVTGVSAAASLYPGQVMHARMKPKPHRFTYAVFNLLIDLDRLAEADRQTALFRVGRAGALSFHAKDHGPGDGSDLAAYARRMLAEAGLAEPPARVELLCYPRLFGFAFNPISVYFAYAASGEPSGIIYEVRNTFGEMHTYVAPVLAGELSEAGLRQERDKLFYVSPFVGMPMRYRFRLRPPGDDVAIRILETDAEGPLLSATFHGRKREMTAASVFLAILRFPLMTMKVVAGIHYEAARLWLKGIRFHTRPAPPPAASFGDRFADGTPLWRQQ
jgi:uncharacterized protein